MLLNPPHFKNAVFYSFRTCECRNVINCIISNLFVLLTTSVSGQILPLSVYIGYTYRNHTALFLLKKISLFYSLCSNPPHFNIDQQVKQEKELCWRALHLILSLWAEETGHVLKQILHILILIFLNKPRAVAVNYVVVFF